MITAPSTSNKPTNGLLSPTSGGETAASSDNEGSVNSKSVRNFLDYLGGFDLIVPSEQKDKEEKVIRGIQGDINMCIPILSNCNDQHMNISASESVLVKIPPTCER
jgi:hypothetical protein